MLNKSINYFIKYPLFAFLLLILFLGWGSINAPFGKLFSFLPNESVAVDAIPDLGENQQIVYTTWEGQSPQDIEDQITYPLTSSLLGIPGVKTIRSNSMFGFSSIYVIFDEDVEFYWSRSRIVEKLNSLPRNLLPSGVQPQLGPDATALGQLFWYTLEGRDENGKVTGGWDLQEVRSIQDYYVKYALASAEGVSEVASIGGHVAEYQVDVDPDLLKQYGIDLQQVVQAVKQTNRDIGAQTLEINKVEYLVRGLGYVKSIEDLKNTVISAKEFKSIRLKDIARISMGPKARRGILDKEGAEVTGGVVTARYGANPMEVISEVKKKIEEIQVGLPSKVLADGRTSQLTLVPFYDRSELINETLATLQEALTLEILITILVVVVMVFNIRASLLISSLLPVAVLLVFISMKLFGVEANIVALSGIAIAIGTMVDIGVVLTENILRHLEEKAEDTGIKEAVFKATKEVSGAILTAVFTTIISFIPIFTMIGAEGKLFKPLAFTKTMALLWSVVVALFIIPPFAAYIFKKRQLKPLLKTAVNALLLLVGLYALIVGNNLGLLLIGFGLIPIVGTKIEVIQKNNSMLQMGITVLGLILLLSYYWKPLGFDRSLIINVLFVGLLSGLLLWSFYIFQRYYTRILTWALNNKLKFLSLPIILLLIGLNIMRSTGREFMPALNEGSFLLMPTSLPHSGIEENKRVLQQLDMAVAGIPEIEVVVGKAGRVESALDPAPISMYENLIQYRPEFVLNPAGFPQRFKTNEDGYFVLKNDKVAANPNLEVSNAVRYKDNHVSDPLQIDRELLIADPSGSYFRNWRPEIKSPSDIWQKITERTKLPGVTSAPKLQPIETRLVMLQTGMRAPMGIKIKGQNLAQIEAFGLEIEPLLKEVEGVKAEAVFADRIVGKPYLNITIDREKLMRYGLRIEDVQQQLEIAVGGKVLAQTVEGRERYGIRVRYPREKRQGQSDLSSIYINLPNANVLPLSELAQFKYEKGPQAIKSEDGFLVGYVLFDKLSGYAEVDVVENAQRYLEEQIKSGALQIPDGVNYAFTGTYENQVRAQKSLSLVIPLALLIIFVLLYIQFKSSYTALMVFTGVAVAFSGGFILLWLYGQDWFLNVSFLGENLRDLFQIHPINLSVAVWVGFIALFGIATDDGVIMATYLKQSFERNSPKGINEIHQAVIEAGQKRIRPCLMTTATTILALFPILTSTGKGSDIMIPMAIPSFGGMLIALITLFVVPVLFGWRKEVELKSSQA